MPEITRRSLLRGAGGAVLAGTAAAATIGTAATPAIAHRSPRRSTSTRLVLLGTAGGPGVYADRTGIASALVVGDAFYVVDLGHGALGRIAQADLVTPTGPGTRTLEGLAGVFLTHLHSDHVAEYASLVINGMWNGLDDPSSSVPVFGPGDRGGLPPVYGDRPEPPVLGGDDPTPGTVAMTARIVDAFAADLNERVRGSGGVNPADSFTVQDITLPPSVHAPVDQAPMPRIRPIVVHEDDRVRVTATLVEHSPVFPAFAFRFETDEGSVTFSGDTAPSDNLRELAAGTDILVHEVIDRAWVESVYPEPRTPQAEATMTHLLQSHTTIEDVGKVAEAVRTPRLVLNHIVPVDNPKSRWLDAGKGYSGKVTPGEDLHEVELRGRKS